MGDERRGDPTLSLVKAEAPSDAGVLVIDAGTPAETRFSLGEGPVVIGSGKGVTIQLNDPHVSSQHAQVGRSAEGYVVQDVGSRNGTQVDGVRIQSALLQPGATITIGNTRLRYESGRPGEARARAEEEGGPIQFGSTIGEAPAMRQLFGLLSRIAPTDLSTCILGETGSGKDVIARAIHQASLRRDRAFVVIDCGAVAANLIESELFGHVRGAFTGAVAERAGAFERAHGGTIFLDEIGELALDLQPKLLRALETGLVTRVGGGTSVQCDVRILAATNRDLEQDVTVGRFRQDLWFRLSAAVVKLPPLRERRQDLSALARRFANEARGGLGVSEAAMNILQNHDWPGNVRELKNVIEGAAAVCERSELGPRDFVLFSRRARQPTVDRLPLAGKSLDDIERAAIRQSLAHFGGNKTRAAEALGIAPSTLYAKIKKYDL